MTYNDDIKFTDYKCICDNIHPFDYVKDLITKKNGYIYYTEMMLQMMSYMIKQELHIFKKNKILKF